MTCSVRACACLRAWVSARSLTPVGHLWLGGRFSDTVAHIPIRLTGSVVYWRGELTFSIWTEMDDIQMSAAGAEQESIRGLFPHLLPLSSYYPGTLPYWHWKPPSPTLTLSYKCFFKSRMSNCHVFFSPNSSMLRCVCVCVCLEAQVPMAPCRLSLALISSGYWPLVLLLRSTLTWGVKRIHESLKTPNDRSDCVRLRAADAVDLGLVLMT